MTTEAYIDGVLMERRSDLPALANLSHWDNPIEEEIGKVGVTLINPEKLAKRYHYVRVIGLIAIGVFTFLALHWVFIVSASVVTIGFHRAFAKQRNTIQSINSTIAQLNTLKDNLGNAEFGKFVIPALKCYRYFVVISTSRDTQMTLAKKSGDSNSLALIELGRKTRDTRDWTVIQEQLQAMAKEKSIALADNATTVKELLGVFNCFLKISAEATTIPTSTPQRKFTGHRREPLMQILVKEIALANQLGKL